MLGIILCGGQSQRMGSDKGLLKQEEKTWTQSAIDKMSALNIPVKISVNKNQYPTYAEIFSANDLIIDNDTLSVKGPLLGVLSCHLAFPAEDIFLLACDMPLMESAILSSLYKTYQQQSSDAYIFTNNEEAEPLCAIYTAKGMAVIHSMLNKGELIKYSMKFMLEHLDVIEIPIKEEEKKYFMNINHHSELNGL
jgi:molybdenum cofactor guanylyltransferase